MAKLPPYVNRVKNRHGKIYYYFHKCRGSKDQSKPQKLPEYPSAEFWTGYAKLTNTSLVSSPDTVRSIMDLWHKSPEWSQLSNKTKIEWTRYCKRICDAWGDLEVVGIEPKNVAKLRDVYADQPATANNLIRCLSSFMAWTVPRGYRKDNPCREVKHLKGGASYNPWPWTIVEQVQKELEPTHPELWHVVAVALFTGQRLGDCLKMRWDQVKDNLISVKQDKTGKELFIPLHKTLNLTLESIPRRAVTILTNSKGTPWLTGFQASWQKAKPDCLEGYVFHGLRKTAVVTLLEAGCTEAEVASITGQTWEMVELYAKKVNQKRLASAAILKWEKHK